MILSGGQLWRHITAAIAVIIVSCLLITSIAHAMEPVFDSHVVEHAVGDVDHDDAGDGDAPVHGCVAHCQGHNYATPSLMSVLDLPALSDAGWMPGISQALFPALVLGLERPPRV